MGKMSTSLWLFVTLSLLSSCGYVDNTFGIPKGSEKQITDSESMFNSFVSGSTLFSMDADIVIPEASHGTQIEYHAPDGTSYLWYPRNTSVVRGRWKVDADSSGRTILCYLYGPNAYNPLTNQGGGSWECRRASAQLVYTDGAIKGDPFELQSGSIPFVIPDRGIHFPADLYRSWGKDPSELDYITSIGEL
jgi:hypothetical protein